MKLLAAIRTFVASCVVPGWGFWIVGKPRLGLAVCGGMLALILLFSWTRLVIDPRGYVTLIALYFALLFWGAIHSAINELGRDPETAQPRNWSASLIYAAVAFAVLYPLLSYRSHTLGYDAFRVPAQSMAATLVVGDYVVADTWHYANTDLQIGEIALFEAPGGVVYVKRVVGLPGDVLAYADSQLIRNGVAVAEPFAVYGDSRASAAGSFSDLTVPDGQYFVLGDNRNFSRDSRHIGTIPKAKFVGRAAHVWYSKNEQQGIQWQRFPNTID